MITGKGYIAVGGFYGKICVVFNALRILKSLSECTAVCIVGYIVTVDDKLGVKSLSVFIFAEGCRDIVIAEVGH